MKKKVAVILSALFAFALLFASAAAFAQSYAMAPPHKSPPSATATSKPGKDKNDKVDKAAERLAFIKEIQPLLDEIAQGRQQIKTLNNNLVTARQQALKHIESLKADLANVTTEQIAKISDLLTQIKQVRIDFNGSDTGMVKQIHTLRGNRKTKEYEALKAAYQNVIAIQEERIGDFKKLIDLYNQISLV